MNKKICLLTIISALLLMGCGLDAIDPETGQVGTLSGTVVDTHSDYSIIEGAVEFENDYYPITDGNFQLKDLSYGNHTITIHKNFYKPREVTININSKNNIINVKMETIYSEEDLDLFARLVFAEARGEDYEGKLAVAATILNRVLDDRFPGHSHMQPWDPQALVAVMTEVVTYSNISYYQYEPFKKRANGTRPIDYNPNPHNNAEWQAWIDSIEAVRESLIGKDPSEGATGFFAHDIVPKYKADGTMSYVWEQWHENPTRRIGGHSFFKQN